jgi:iron complex outermembrane recepter protein
VKEGLTAPIVRLVNKTEMSINGEGSGMSVLQYFARLATGTSLLAITVAASLGTSGAARAQQADADQAGGLDEIVVTARKRAESLQDVPAAVSAIGGAKLDALDVQSAEDLSALSPNLFTSKTTVSFTAPQFYMRGAGRSNHNWNAENAVAVFVDDIYLQSTASAFIEVNDFERVEVLRGPQGTLYGRNATTGAIKFVPRRPDLSGIGGFADAGYGSHNRLNLSGAINVPLVEDKFAVRLSTYYNRTDGFVTRVTEANQTLDKDFAKQSHFGVRLGSLFQATDDLEFELNLDYSKYNDGTNLVTPIQAPNPLDFTQILSKRGTVNFRPVFGVNRVATQPLTRDGGSKYEGFGAVFKASWTTEAGTLKSITGYRKYDEYFLAQLGGRGVPSTVFGLELFSTVDSKNDYEQFSQELQFSGSFLDDKIKYVLGGFYFHNSWQQLQYGSIIGAPAAFSPVRFPGAPRSYGGTWNDTDQTTNSYALYLDGSWEVFDGISLLAGVRQSWDEKDVTYDSRFEDNVLRYPGFPVRPSKNFSKFTPRVGLEWQALEDVLLYFTYSVGYKAGNLEGDRASSPGPASNWLRPEVIKNFEGGVKATLFDNTLRANLTVFSSEYTNKADLASPQTVAVADVDIDGIEAELTWAPIKGLSIFTNLGLLDAKYARADADHPIFNRDPTGFAPGLKAKPPVTPDYSITAGASYAYGFDDGSDVEISGSLQAVGEHYNGLGVENYDSEIVKAYQVVDLSVRYTFADQRFSATVGVNNLFDATYYTTGFFGAVPEVAGRYYGDGRNWFAKVRYSF